MNRCVILQQRSTTQSMDYDPSEGHASSNFAYHKFDPRTRTVSVYLLKDHSTRNRQKG